VGKGIPQAGDVSVDRVRKPESESAGEPPVTSCASRPLWPAQCRTGARANGTRRRPARDRRR
jgi:hypothetical protein